MCKEYDENGERLAELVFNLGSFTEDELVRKFSKMQSGSIEIGRLQSIHDYLDDLREMGVLAFEGGRYKVLERSRNQHPVAA